MKGFLALSLLTLVACSREEPPIGDVKVTPATLLVRPGQCAPLKFTWTPRLPLEKRDGTPRVFVHLLDGPDNLVRTFDHSLPFQWTPGREESYEIDVCQSAIAPSLNATPHLLKIGIYDDAIGYRWPLNASGIDTGNRSYQVGGVSVPASNGRIPKFAFEGGWHPVESAGDKQIVSRRQFRTGVKLSVSGITRGGTLKMMVRPSEKSGPLSITPTCGMAPVTFATPALHDVEFPIAAIPGGNCEFLFTLTGAGTAALEMLGWETSP